MSTFPVDPLHASHSWGGACVWIEHARAHERALKQCIDSYQDKWLLERPDVKHVLDIRDLSYQAWVKTIMALIRWSHE